MVANQTEIKKRKSNRNWAIRRWWQMIMVANQTGIKKGNESLTETGQCRRLRDSWWQMIMVANQTEIMEKMEMESLTETGQYRRLRDSWWRIRQTLKKSKI